MDWSLHPCRVRIFSDLFLDCDISPSYTVYIAADLVAFEMIAYVARSIMGYDLIDVSVRINSSLWYLGRCM